MKELISIIVPVYNTGKYLKRCLESIINQSYTDIEIILVNDGSFDNSFEIIEEYSHIDNRIIVINQTNQGLSIARNNGLNIANGNYVLFIDSDDFVDIRLVQKLLDSIRDSNCQIAAARSMNSNLPKPENDDYIFIRKLSRDEAMTGLLDNTLVSESACCKLFAMSLFSEIRFVEGMIHEDSEILPRIIMKCNSVIYLNYYGYFCEPRENSITRSKYSLKNLAKNKAYFERYILLKNTQHGPKALNRLIGNELYSILMLMKNYEDGYLKEVKKIMSEIIAQSKGELDVLESRFKFLIPIISFINAFLSIFIKE